MYRIAVHADDQLLTSGRRQSFSDRWAQLLRDAGHECRLVDATRPDFFERLEGCDGFMWWYAHLPFPRHFARRVVAAVEHGMGIPVFPTWKTVWHFDDKVGQDYLLRAAGLPTPQTRVFWYRRAAVEYCRAAAYPLVFKLAGGITSENVLLLRDFGEAEYWINRMFGEGLITLNKPAVHGFGDVIQRLRDAARLMVKGLPPRGSLRNDPQRGYFFAQEFLAGNEYDTRVTVIGDRAFAFRRFNRPNDFRASGSGRIDFDPARIDPGMVRLAFRAQRALGSQSLAIDGMYRNAAGSPRGERLICEISYYYEGWALAACPGHWRLRGEPDSGRLDWVEGSLGPEDAILEDFVDLVRSGPPPRANDAISSETPAAVFLSDA